MAIGVIVGKAGKAGKAAKKVLKKDKATQRPGEFSKWTDAERASWEKTKKAADVKHQAWKKQQEQLKTGTKELKDNLNKLATKSSAPKKAADSMSKKERTALKKQKDAERKAARGAARTAKKESRQKIAVVKPQNKGVMGGNKPMATVNPKNITRGGTAPKRVEKEVKGEVVSTSKLKGGDPKSPKVASGKKASWKKAAAIGTVAAVGATAVSTMDGKKKEEASKSQPKAAASKPVSSTATAASSPGKKAPSEFGKAFKAARKSGKEVFEYKGKKYHSYTKEEVAKMSPEEKKAKRKKGAYV